MRIPSREKAQFSPALGINILYAFPVPGARIECHPLKTNAPQSARRSSDRQPDLSMAPKIICRIPGEGWQVNAQNCKSNSAAWDNGRDIDPHPCLPHSTPQNASRQKASGQSGAGVHEWGRGQFNVFMKTVNFIQLEILSPPFLIFENGGGRRGSNA